MARIGFVSTLDGVPWGGSEALWSQTARELHRRGHQVGATVHGWPQTPKSVQELQNLGIAIQERKTRLAARLAKRVLRKTGGNNATWLDQFRPELVLISLHCHAFGLEWMQACQKRHIPYAVVTHAVVDHFWCGDGRQQPLAQALNAAQGLFFVSRGNVRQVRLQLADDLPNATVVRNPFNVSYNAAPPWPGEADTIPLRLACVGRLDPGTKGQDIIFDVLRQAKWRPRALHLTLFGDGPHRTSLEALAAYYGLNNVHFAGVTPDVESIWREHHALVLASRAEGLPIVIVEAMLCGRACIVTDVAGNAELLEDNVSGFVAAAPKAEFLDEAMERAWNAWQQNKLQEVGQVAAQQIRKQVPEKPIAVFAQQLEQLL